ncbi:MAG: hypothetical protein Kow0049_09280 [Stanieria sp.]
MLVQTNIKELSLGSVATIVGFDKVYGGYIGKLLAKGLTPGTTFTVLNLTLPGSEIAIMLPEKIVKLSKPEVDALCVEEIKEEES